MLGNIYSCHHCVPTIFRNKYFVNSKNKVVCTWIDKMEAVQDNLLLELNPNAMEDIRREFNLHEPEVMAEVINNFEEWIQKQDHFIKKDFPRRYLETSVIMSKGSLERAKISLEKLCTLKTLMPSMFCEDNLKKLPNIRNFIISAMLPKPMKDNYRIYLIRFLSSDIETTMLYDYYKVSMMIMEYIKLHDYLAGCTAVVDCRDINNVVAFVMKINIAQLRDALTVIMEGYALRIKGIHLISGSKAIEALVAVIKQVVSSKLGSRIRVHKTLEELYEHVPKELLPMEYGGNEKSLWELYNDWCSVLSGENTLEYLRDICQPGTNEALRPTEQYNDRVLGMPGSFRSLTVD